MSNKIKLFTIVILLITLIKNSLQLEPIFNLKFINADSNAARFQLVDNNETTINYTIAYDLNSNKETSSNILQSITSSKTFIMQTNSDKLALLQQMKQNETIDETATSGENYSNDELRRIQSESWSDMHQFTIDNLDENRLYTIQFKITAKTMHLKHKSSNESKTNSRQFMFHFKTFNFEAAAKNACEQSKNQTNETHCYETNSNCLKCNTNCYENKQSNKSTGPILCQPCPCDTTRSTGSCLYNQNDDSVQCKQCIKPYAGPLCSQCENDGIDYYKDEFNQCLSCNCSGNSWADNNNPLNAIRNGNKRRKCQAITGVCIDCQFNTTGKHCSECRAGFVGDALKRTCLLRVNLIKAQSTTIGNYVNHKNNNNNYRSLALFSIYIFCILFLIIIVYLFIKYKYYQDAALKNGPYHPLVCCSLSKPISDLFNRLSEAILRLSLYMASFFPYNVTKMRANEHLNDDDRLNLAEYQMFDESLYATERSIVNDPFSDNDDVNLNCKNPYRSLTIKS